MENFAVTIAFLLIGMALKYIPDFSIETGKILNLFVIYISLPALILLNIPKLVFSSALLVPGLMPWAMILFSSGLVIGLSAIFKWDRPITGSLLLLVPLGNTSFLGVPMVTAFFGEESVPYAILYDQLGSFLALATYGSVVIAFYGAGDMKPSLKFICKKVISFPPFISLIFALSIKSISYPQLFIDILTKLSSTLVPVVMIAVGFQLSLRIDRSLIPPMFIGLAIKLVASPLMALFVCKIVGLEGDVVDVSIFEAGMPPMISAGAVAIIANLSPALTAALVGMGIVLSFITLPTLYQIIL